MAEKKTPKQFTPKQLRTLLSVLLALIFIGAVALFYFGNSALKDLSEKVSKTTIDAEASEKKLQNLQSLKQQIAQSSALIAKADQMFAPIDTYQSQVIGDLKAYAQRDSITISGTQFEDDKSNPERKIVSVAIDDAIAYDSLVKFLHDIENNVPKMQVISLSLERPATGVGSNVKVSNFKLSVAVK